MILLVTRVTASTHVTHAIVKAAITATATTRVTLAVIPVAVTTFRVVPIIAVIELAKHNATIPDAEARVGRIVLKQLERIPNQFIFLN